MKNRSTSNSAWAINSRGNALKSLLTLASGAASLGALAPAAEAGIIYTAFAVPVTVGFGGGSQLTEFNIDLPGTAILQFVRNGILEGGSRRISARQLYIKADPLAHAYVGVGQQGTTSAAFRANAGANWNSPSLVEGANFGHIIRTVSGNIAGPGGFSSITYLLFFFTDTSPLPMPDSTRYGWVGMSSATATFGDSANMSVTFTGWAYEEAADTYINAGAGITAVPEVSTGVVSALLAAMVVGGAELRRWRKSKSASVRQPA